MVHATHAAHHAALAVNHVAPLFSHEGPDLYQQAHAHNAAFAKPAPYQTKLAPEQEKHFRQWVSRAKVPFDPNAKTVDYDMRGYWKATGGRDWGGQGQHFPDTYKTPYDTTFSNESKYATKNNPFVWLGNNLVDSRNGQMIFGKSFTGLSGPFGPAFDIPLPHHP